MSQSTGLGCPASNINSHWLSILHMVMYVSMLFSQIIPPSSCKVFILQLKKNILYMGKLTRWHWSGSLTLCSVNNDFAWLCNGWDHLCHCTCTSWCIHLATGYFGSVNIYKLHLAKPWIVVSGCVMLYLVLWLLLQPGENNHDCSS